MKNPRSLSTLLSASIAVLCIAPVAGVSLLANGTIGSRLRDQAGAAALDLSAQIADKLDRSMFERWLDIRMIGRIQETLEPDSDPDRLRVKLETLQRSSPEYAWVGLASPEGRVLVSTGRLLEGADVSGRPWFRAGSRNMFAGDVHEAVLLAKKLPPNANGDPLRFVDVAMPLRRADGVPLGVLGAHLSWSWGEEITASVLNVRGERSESDEALIVSAEGDVLLGPDGLVGGKLDLLSLGAARQGGTRHGLETWPDGRDYLTATTLTTGHRDYPGLGWAVVVRQDADKVLALIKAEGRKAISIPGDLRDEDFCKSLVGQAVEGLGGLDILVNNAGLIRRADAVEFSEKDWDDVMNVNIKSAFFMSQAAGRHFIAQGSGKIINIASMLSFQGGIRVPSYTASKSGIAGITRLLANEWASKGVNINAIAPGYMATDNTAQLRADEARNKAILDRIPAARWGEPSDLGGTAVFLASRASDYVNGAVIPVDGGWLAR